MQRDGAFPITPSSLSLRPPRTQQTGSGHVTIRSNLSSLKGPRPPLLCARLGLFSHSVVSDLPPRGLPASPSFTLPWSLLRLMSTESVTPPLCLILASLCGVGVWGRG